MSKYLVLASGGLDSAVLLYSLVRNNDRDDVIALGVSYGQKHAKEQEYLRWICRHLGIRLIQEDLSKVFKYDNKCTLLETSEGDIPRGPYKEGLQSTYVPFRNGLFLSYATSVALQLGCTQIVYGAHLDDSVGDAYPDCSPVFVEAISQAIYEGSGKAVTLSAPYIKMNFTKKDIVKYGLTEGKMTKEEFSHTWSCYDGKDKPCHTCATCIDRRKAFEVNNIFDID